MVKVVKIDDVIKKKVAFFKMDIEGDGIGSLDGSTGNN